MTGTTASTGTGRTPLNGTRAEQGSTRHNRNRAQRTAWNSAQQPYGTQTITIYHYP